MNNRIFVLLVLRFCFVVVYRLFSVNDSVLGVLVKVLLVRLWILLWVVGLGINLVKIVVSNLVLVLIFCGVKL